MAFRAGFAEVDITPALGCQKAGWIQPIMVDRIRDPLSARVAVFESGDTRIGFVAMDVLSVRWTQVVQIREAAARAGVPGENVMVTATHSHGGPAVVDLGLVKRDEAYLETMVALICDAFQQAANNLTAASVAFGVGAEGRFSVIRRCHMRDGSVKTHPAPGNPEIICQQGVIDPRLGTIAVKDAAGVMRGMIVSFTCHPTEQGGNTSISADWPGETARFIKRAFGDQCVPLIVNGAFGDIRPAGPLNPNTHDMVDMGRALANQIAGNLREAAFTDELPLTVDARDVKLPYRDLDGPHGRDHKWRQRFGGKYSEQYYESSIVKLREKIAARPYAPAQIQTIRLGADHAMVAIPGEFFSCLGFEIKKRSAVPHTWIAGAANGMVGYLPDRLSHDLGGYETTLALSSKLAVGAGETLVETAVEMLQG